MVQCIDWCMMFPHTHIDTCSLSNNVESDTRTGTRTGTRTDMYELTNIYNLRIFLVMPTDSKANASYGTLGACYRFEENESTQRT